MPLAAGLNLPYHLNPAPVAKLSLPALGCTSRHFFKGREQPQAKAPEPPYVFAVGNSQGGLDPWGGD